MVNYFICRPHAGSPGGRARGLALVSVDPPLAGVKDGVDRFLVPSTSVAVRPLGNTYEAYVPNGLSILYALRTASGDTRAPGNR